MTKFNKIIILSNWLLLINLSIKAQLSANSAGGNAVGTGGSTAFSVGQALYTTATGSNGSIGQGVQQAFVASNPLPINFQFFSGKCNMGNLKLSWATSYETNNAYFDVEKSQNATKWQKIATISGAINSKEIKKYEFIDAETASSIATSLYYRIKQTDLDGKYSYSNVIAALRCTETLQAVSIFPNPTVDVVNIKINQTENAFYELYDLSGKMLDTQPLTESTYLSLQNKISADYFLKILSDKKEIKTFKIIKK